MDRQMHLGKHKIFAACAFGPFFYIDFAVSSSQPVLLGTDFHEEAVHFSDMHA
jgi:hypothetical protein